MKTRRKQNCFEIRKKNLLLILGCLVNWIQSSWWLNNYMLKIISISIFFHNGKKFLKIVRTQKRICLINSYVILYSQSLLNTLQDSFSVVQLLLLQKLKLLAGTVCARLQQRWVVERASPLAGSFFSVFWSVEVIGVSVWPPSNDWWLAIGVQAEAEPFTCHWQPLLSAMIEKPDKRCHYHYSLTSSTLSWRTFLPFLCAVTLWPDALGLILRGRKKYRFQALRLFLLVLLSWLNLWGIGKL